MTDELTKVLEYLRARGEKSKGEATALLAGTDRREGNRHVRAATLLIDAQTALAIRSELAAGKHLSDGAERLNECTCSKILPWDSQLCPRHG